MSHDDRKTHAGEYQRGMHIHQGAPACFAEDSDRALAPAFWDAGKACACASTQSLWRVHLRHTPGCAEPRLCARAARAISFWPETGALDHD